jgi:DNA-binding NarL/FixJ family response regulator
VRGAIRSFIEATTPYRVCDEAADRSSAVQKAKEFCCELVLIHLKVPIVDHADTASTLRVEQPEMKIVGFTMFDGDLKNQASASAGFDVVLRKEDGLSKLLATLKALMPNR